MTSQFLTLVLLEMIEYASKTDSFIDQRKTRQTCFLLLSVRQDKPTYN